MADRGRSRCDRWIEAVDVDRDIDALAVGNVCERCRGTLCPDLAQGNDVGAIGLGSFPILAAHGRHVMWPERGDPLHMGHLGGAAHRTAMPPGDAVALVDEVEMGVE